MDTQNSGLMEAKSFNFGGRTLPARMSMGALRRFRRETGQDFLKLQTEGEVSAEALAVLLWCCISAQSRVDGVEFNVSCDDFLDRVTPDEVSAWYVDTPEAGGDAGNDTEGGESKKKGVPA